MGKYRRGTNLLITKTNHFSVMVIVLYLQVGSPQQHERTMQSEHFGLAEASGVYSPWHWQHRLG